MDDHRIIEALFKRSETAIDELTKKYGKTIYGICYNILKNKEDADECVSDCLLGIWNSIPPTRPESLYAYVCRVARNVAITKYKYNNAARRNSSLRTSLDEITSLVSEDISEDRAVTDITDALNDWLRTLNIKNRYIFVRKYWYMDGVDEISKHLGISISAVYLRIDRMKKSLCKFLKERGITV